MGSDSQTLYQENPIPGGTPTLVYGIVVGVFGTALAVVFGWPLVGVVAGVIGVLSLLLMSTLRYFGITISSDELVVGRDRLDVSALDPAFGVRPAEQQLPDGTLASLEVGLSNKRGDLHILGGGYGRPKNGSSWLMVQEHTGQQHILASRNPSRFTDALTAALREPRG